MGAVVAHRRGGNRTGGGGRATCARGYCIAERGAELRAKHLDAGCYRHGARQYGPHSACTVRDESTGEEPPPQFCRKSRLSHSSQRSLGRRAGPSNSEPRADYQSTSCRRSNQAVHLGCRSRNRVEPWSPRASPRIPVDLRETLRRAACSPEPRPRPRSTSPRYPG